MAGNAPKNVTSFLKAVSEMTRWSIDVGCGIKLPDYANQHRCRGLWTGFLAHGPRAFESGRVLDIDQPNHLQSVSECAHQ